MGMDPYRERVAGNRKRFADLCPLLLLNRKSAQFIGAMCPGGREYPLDGFRGNIIVSGEQLKPWEEETWREISVTGLDGDVRLKKIKECVRCMVPCRDSQTGKVLFKDDPTLMWKVLKKTFPRKYDDPEWGSWGHAPLFGV